MTIDKLLLEEFEDICLAETLLSALILNERLDIEQLGPGMVLDIRLALKDMGLVPVHIIPAFKELHHPYVYAVATAGRVILQYAATRKNEDEKEALLVLQEGIKAHSAKYALWENPGGGWMGLVTNLLPPDRFVRPKTWDERALKFAYDVLVKANLALKLPERELVSGYDTGDLLRLKGSIGAVHLGKTKGIEAVLANYKALAVGRFPLSAKA